MDPVSHAILSGKYDVGILGSLTFVAQGINVFYSLGRCLRKCNLSVQGVESSNSKEFWRANIAVEVLLQRGPGTPDTPNEAVERLVSREPDTGMEPEQEERERGVALAKAVEITAENSMSAGGGGVKLREILDRHWNAFWRGLPVLSY